MSDYCIVNYIKSEEQEKEIPQGACALQPPPPIFEIITTALWDATGSRIC